LNVLKLYAQYGAKPATMAFGFQVAKRCEDSDVPVRVRISSINELTDRDELDVNVGHVLSIDEAKTTNARLMLDTAQSHNLPSGE